MDESIRVRACLAIVNAGKLLLVPHYQTDEGVAVQWNLPGGKCEPISQMLRFCAFAGGNPGCGTAAPKGGNGHIDDRLLRYRQKVVDVDG